MKTKICFLIDDDDDDLDFLEIGLHKIDTHIRCMSANSCKDALQKLTVNEDFTPDYIFIDLHMPLIDGKQCLVEIKKINRFKSVPVVMYSTSMAEQDIEETKRLGATAYISKPNSIAQLEIALKAFFSHYHLKPKTYEY
jgi:CheY-like chemotaxis protein